MNILESLSFFLSWFYWNPSREAFYIPYVHHPVVWYGICFAIGFLCSYFVVRRLFAQTFMADGALRLAKILPAKANKAELAKMAKQLAASLTDKLTLYVVVGVVVGARLVEVLFYDFAHYLAHPLDIFKIWEGGLASHGGVAGILLAVCLFRLAIKKSYPYLSFLFLMDILSISSGVASGFIRIGNFFNQEILGIETTVPWAVVFGNPWNGEAIMPRHPVQLYEALAYFAAFALLIYRWKRKGPNAKEGSYLGWLLLFIFGSRFLLEFLKLPQTADAVSESFLSTGQFLSLPFIALAVFLLVRKGCYRKFRCESRS